MSGRDCDICDDQGYTIKNPRVLVCQRRPSDHSDMCCVMAGHLKCLSKGTAVEQLPQITQTGGVATGAQWEEWIESAQAVEWGFLFLT